MLQVIYRFFSLFRRRKPPAVAIAATQPAALIEIECEPEELTGMAIRALVEHPKYYVRARCVNGVGKITCLKGVPADGVTLQISTPGLPVKRVRATEQQLDEYLHGSLKVDYMEPICAESYLQRLKLAAECRLAAHKAAEGELAEKTKQARCVVEKIETDLSIKCKTN